MHLAAGFMNNSAGRWMIQLKKWTVDLIRQQNKLLFSLEPGAWFFGIEFAED
jgi:hypothetical protein